MSYIATVNIDSLNGIAAIALLLIVSFAIDRVVTSVMFVACFIEPVRNWLRELSEAKNDDERRQYSRRRRLVYYALTLVFALAAVFPPVGLFKSKGEEGAFTGVRIVQPLLAQSLIEFVSQEESAKAARERAEETGDEVEALQKKLGSERDQDKKAKLSERLKEAELEKTRLEIEANKKEEAAAGVPSSIGELVKARVPDRLDAIITLIVLVGGSDWIAALLRIPGSIRGKEDDEKGSRPVELSGKFALENDGGEDRAEGGKKS